MNFLLRQNASKLFLLVVTASLASLIAVGTLSVTTVSKVKIGSELHDQIIEGKDLIADVLPPPLYVIEAYQIVGRLPEAKDNEQEKLVVDLERLEKEYKTRLDVWSAQKVEHAGDATLQKTFTILLEDAKLPVDTFFAEVKSNYIPAVKDGNREQASKILEEILKPAFEKHRAAIDEVVQLANAHNEKVTSEAGVTVARSSWWLYATILSAIAIVVTSSLVVYRLIRHAEERNKDFTGRFNAINRSQAIIEFEPDGTIITANENFLNVTGYALDEVRGKHHRMFIRPEEAATSQYKQMWDDLAAGKILTGQFERINKAGKPFWIQSSYNPILDQNGKTFKVIKYATDITDTKLMEAAIAQRQKEDELAAAETRRRVNEILNVAERVAKRDYTLKLTVKGQDELGQLGEGLARFFDDKKAAEVADQERIDRERALAAETERKVALVLDAVNAVAAGRFDINIPNLGDDAVGQVASALRAAVASMKTALIEVRNVAGTVSTASEQLNGVSREISSGAQSQASSLEETASSLEEITSTVKQNTDNAQQARQLANGSRDVAERGGSVVQEAVVAMEEINQSSKRIADIITTIDEIAFQTNLLALNAAVEAARAGEQGRGFAVVAAEVRNLAQRSASAAREIKVLIQDSVEKVANGTNLVNKSGQTLSEIVTSVKRVTDIVAEIAAASKEQLVGIEQVNKAVAQMDRVTQANAAQTEEMSGTAGMLLTHAEQLAELVGSFQLDEQPREKVVKSREKSKPSVSVDEPPARPAPIALSPMFSEASGVLEF